MRPLLPLCVVNYLQFFARTPHAGIQPQGRGSFSQCGGSNPRRRSAPEQENWRGHGKNREGRARVNCLFEQRSGPSHPHPFDQSATNRFRETERSRDLHRTAPAKLRAFQSGPRTWLVSGLLAVLVLLPACGKKPVRVSVPPAPNPPAEGQPASESPGHMPAPPPSPPTRPPAKNDDESNSNAKDFGLPPEAVPLLTATGLASWYGPPYHNRKASNGEVFDMNAMTAASLTLPLGTIVRVTNVKTGDSALVRINDRGPFVAGRILDLSMAAAKKIDLWRAGVAQVRLEVLKAPSPLDTGGRWCVQIGSLQDEDSAAALQNHLKRRYREAKVVKFLSPVGVWWVRVRVSDDDRTRAETLARETQPDKGTVFLVRLD